jgi:predicted transcriptional regulator
MSDKAMLARLTAELVSSYVGNSSLSDSELDGAIERLPALIEKVHAALLKIIVEPTDAGEAPQIREEAAPTSAGGGPAKEVGEAAPVETIFPEYLICLEDGQRFKTLKRHLAIHHGMTPGEYRIKWDLPNDYPMAAPSYAASRAEIAKRIGLGADGRGGKPRVRQRSVPRAKSR